jgi:C4-dicarboxylate transporter DctQ subunit
MKKLKKLIGSMEDWVSGGLIFIGVMVIFFGIVSRNVFQNPLVWTDEISRYLIIWGTLIGATVALKNDYHIRVEVLYNKFPKPLKHITNLFVNAVGCGFSIFLIYYGYNSVIHYFDLGQRSLDTQMPLWIVYLILPISGILLGSRFFYRFIKLVIGKTEENHQNGPELHE